MNDESSDEKSARFRADHYLARSAGLTIQPQSGISVTYLMNETWMVPGSLCCAGHLSGTVATVATATMQAQVVGNGSGGAWQLQLPSLA